MKPLQALLRNAAKSNRKIVLSEGEDPRVIKAAILARADKVARLVLVGDGRAITSGLTAAGWQGEGIEIHDPADSPHRGDMSEFFADIRRHKNVSLEQAQAAVADRNVYAALLVRMGLADGTVGGAATTTAEMVRIAIQMIGPAPGTKLISSFFLMLFCEPHHVKKGAVVFADGGLVIDPSAAEMAEIGRASAASFTQLTGDVPKVAMLSFSTRGSAKSDSVSKVAEATTLLRDMAPNLIVDGEIQFDAAFVPEIAASKAPDSPLGGDANVFVFPNLDAGNIGYKIAQRIGGANAIGPVLQGLAKPANDLSRGCSTEDILHMIAITSAQCDG